MQEVAAFQQLIGPIEGYCLLLPEYNIDHKYCLQY